MTTTPRTAEQAEGDSLEVLAGSSLLKSECLRSKALLSITLLLLAVISVILFTPGLLPSAQENTLRPALTVMMRLMLVLTVYEWLAVAWLRRCLRESRFIRDRWRYANAVVEILLLTLIIWDWSQVAGPLQTVGGVLPWLYFPVIAASALHLKPRLCWFGGVCSALSFLVLAKLITRGWSDANAPLLASGTSFVLKGLLLMVCGAVAAFVAAQLREHLVNAIQSSRERDRAVSIFGQHVSPQVARRLIDQPAEFSAELRHVCVLFLDIRGFSTIAASRTPAEVMEYLNTLFSPMIAIVNQHGGIVNKFLGDGFMAIFGAPFADPELHRNAVRCALALLASAERLNAAKSVVPTRLGIGIHAGNAMAGTVGSSLRKEYTLLGDTVNAAARIEQETKKLGAQILVSGVVLEGLDEEKKQAEDLGEVTLRGISQPLRLYRLA